MGEMLTVRDVDEEIYRKFRERAVVDRVRVGKALAEAMKLWIETKKSEKKPNQRNLLKIKGIITTKRRVKWSEEIDKTLYGWGK